MESTSSTLGPTTPRDPRGPVFISYRQSDGRAIAVALAWALRAAGVPVWHDQTDLPPGDTDRRLAEALSSGLSGAVLVVTPGIAHSEAIRDIELPRLLELENHAEFTLAVGSTVERHHGTGRLDYSAPDRLLGLPTGTVERFNQKPVAAAEECAALAHAMSRQRMENLRPEIQQAGLLTLDVQTRVPPFAGGMDGDLVLRLRPPNEGERRPHRGGLYDLQRFLGHLPQLVAIAGARAVRVRGGAHLSVACALGAALPTTLMGTVEVLDTQGGRWALTGQAPSPAGDRLCVPVTPPVYKLRRWTRARLHRPPTTAERRCVHAIPGPRSDLRGSRPSPLCWRGSARPRSGGSHRGRTRCRHSESGQHAPHERSPPSAALSLPDRAPSRSYPQHAHDSSIRVGEQPRRWRKTESAVPPQRGAALRHWRLPHSRSHSSTIGRRILKGGPDERATQTVQPSPDQD